MISYDPELRKLFEDIDKSKVRIWGLTNAYRLVCLIVVLDETGLYISRQHAERVLRILKLDDLFDGLVYCDYNMKDFVCKPEPEYYEMVGGDL